MSEWRILTQPTGGHRVIRREYVADDWTEVASFESVFTVGDIFALVTDAAEDCDFVLLPDGSPVLVVDVPEEGRG